MKDWDHIEEAFKSAFEDEILPNEPGDWERTSFALEKKKFFSFHFRHFNIYYASLIGLTALASLTTLIHYFFIREEQPVHQELIIQPDTVNRDLQPQETSVQENEEPASYSIVPYKVLPEQPKAQGTNSDSVFTSAGKEEHITPAVQNSESTSLTPVAKNRPIKYIIQQDTIIKYDTITNIKRGKKRP